MSFSCIISVCLFCIAGVDLIVLFTTSIMYLKCHNYVIMYYYIINKLG